MNTPTPDTDEQHARFPMEGFTLYFTRKLERERDEWKTEAKRWRDMYMQFDEMLESDIKDATKKVLDIIALVEKLSKEMDKGY